MPYVGENSLNFPPVDNSLSDSPASLDTNWSVVQDAANLNSEARRVFVQRYLGPVRAYLSARWRGTTWFDMLDDAVQEVFTVCLGESGPLQRLDRTRSAGFRAYLYGIVRNVARNLERRATRRRRRFEGEIHWDLMEVDESSLSTVYDRAWAKAVMRQAAQRQSEQARHSGSAAVRRVELLRLHVHEEVSMREIARCWNVDIQRLYREYAKARREFLAALVDVLATDYDVAPENVERECKALIDML